MTTKNFPIILVQSKTASRLQLNTHNKLIPALRPAVSDGSWTAQHLYVLSHETLKVNDYCMFYGQLSKVLEIEGTSAKIETETILSDNDAEFINSIKTTINKIKAGDFSTMKHSFSISMLPKVVASTNVLITPYALISQSYCEIFSKSYRMGLVIKDVALEMDIIPDLQSWQEKTNLCDNVEAIATINGFVIVKSDVVTERMYTQAEVDEMIINARLDERGRASKIAYDFRDENERAYELKKKAGNEYAFIKHDIAEECRYVGNAITGLNALSVTLNYTMLDKIKEDYYGQ